MCLRWRNNVLVKGHVKELGGVGSRSGPATIGMQCSACEYSSSAGYVARGQFVVDYAGQGGVQSVRREHQETRAASHIMACNTTVINTGDNSKG
jgi:hypothetical protein